MTTILAVDDVPQNTRLLEAVLTANGYGVVSASSGAEALERVKTEALDLVLLDIEMPGMNGYEVCRRVREDERTAFLPVVMLTSHRSEVRVDAIEAGADDFLTKPFDQQELLARVRSLVRIKQYHDTIQAQAAELAGWNRMLEARVAEQVDELEKMARLRRFLSPTLTELILTQGDGILESHRREIAVLFADLRGWTDFSATTEPEEVMGVIGSFHAAMGELILAFEATVGWFAGDGLMVWFNDPVPCPAPATSAVRMAVAMREAMGELRAEWHRRGHDLDFSVGIALGYATLGRIGFEGRYDYGAVGSVMNLASRLCDEAGLGQIVVSRRVLAAVEEIAEVEPMGTLALKGFGKPVEAFGVLDVEKVPGAFNQDNKGRWFKDVVSVASADRTGLSYTIRPDAYWYWGGRKLPVTYKDFVYTLREIDDPGNDIAARAGYSQLDPTRFAHTGGRRVTFFWKTKSCSTDFPCGPYANWQSLFALVYPSVALRGMDFNKIWTSCICGNDGKPVSDGPFYLANYTPGQGTTLKANPFSFEKPKLSEVDFRILDPIAAEQAMLGGQIDAISGGLSQILLPLKNVPAITFDQIPGYYFEHLELREGDAKAAPSVNKGASNVLLRAPWMREAIMLGIDRQRIIDTLFGQLAGNTRPLDSILFYPNQPAYRPDFRRWNYNPSKALAVLRRHCAAGSGPPAPDPANTKFWHCSGLPATFNWTWAAGRDDWTTSEQIAGAELRSIGIQIVERPLPSNVVFGPEGFGSGNFDIVQFRNIDTGDPGDSYESYRCFGSGNWTGYCSHAVDALLNAANGELDPAKRARLFQKADAIMATQLPVIPMYQVPVPLVHRTDLLGMLQNPGVAGPVWNIQDWHWRS